MRRYASRLALLSLLIAALHLCPALAQTALPGYRTPEQINARLAELASHSLAELETLAVAADGQIVQVLRIGGGGPAWAVVANPMGTKPYTTELALELAASLLQQAEADSGVIATLNRSALYFILMPSPAGMAGFTSVPFVERGTTALPWDDDRDGRVDEDGPDDLNGDGWITMQRVADPTGGWRAHPSDPRVLIAVKPEQGELGEFALYVEGVDSDADERWNEDAVGGVNLNRAFPFDYPFFQPGAGEFQLCEPEHRALADFLLDRGEIAGVVVLGQDNLQQLWEAQKDPAAEIKTGLMPSDAGYFKHIAKLYEDGLKPQGKPEPSDGRGSLLKWAYFHAGRWAVGIEPWLASDKQQEEETIVVVPDPAAEAVTSDETTSAPTIAEPAAADETAALPQDDTRGQHELSTLRWMDTHGVDGFAPWTPIEHPDFTGKSVEVGGFKPYYRDNPPLTELDALIGSSSAFLIELTNALPRIELSGLKTEALGGGLTRVSVTVANLGVLPTLTELGELNRWPYPLQLTLKLPQGAALVSGLQRELLPRLLGGGGSVERSWIIRGDGELGIQAHSPTIGNASAAVSLGGA